VAYRDFDAEDEESSGDPITFTFAGRKFRCRHPLPTGALVIAARGMGASGDGMAEAKSVDDLIHRFVDPTQHTELDEAIADSPVEKLVRVAQGLIEAATGRPTTAPSPSPKRSRSVGPRSTGA